MFDYLCSALTQSDIPPSRQRLYHELTKRRSAFSLPPPPPSTGEAPNSSSVGLTSDRPIKKEDGTAVEGTGVASGSGPAVKDKIHLDSINFKGEVFRVGESDSRAARLLFSTDPKHENRRLDPPFQSQRSSSPHCRYRLANLQACRLATALFLSLLVPSSALLSLRLAIALLLKIDGLTLVCLLQKPEETVHPGTRQFYENEVFKTGDYDD